MKRTQQLHSPGQSLCPDKITRALLTSRTPRRYIDDLSVTGLTSNSSIFDVAIKDSNLYDDATRQKTKEGKSGEVWCRGSVVASWLLDVTEDFGGHIEKKQ